MTKNQLLKKLNSSSELVKIAYVPVSEVIKWVNELDEVNIVLKDLVDDITIAIVDKELDLIEDYDLDMNYREVELLSVSIDDSTVRRAVQRVIDQYTPDEEALDEHRVTRD